MTYRHAYWVCTGVLAALMTAAGVPDLLQRDGAVVVFQHLGYPAYLLPFLGTAKLLGVLVLLVPNVTWIKDWAYAGFAVDLTGALYSHVSAGDGPSAWAPAFMGLMLVTGSYSLYRLRAAKRNAEGCLAQARD